MSQPDLTKIRWKLNGIDYIWDVPFLLQPLYEIWLENLGTPDQYLDQYPQKACRIFDAWIRAKEQMLLAELNITRILEELRCEHLAKK